jgi:phage replication O-like protein O
MTAAIEQFTPVPNEILEQFARLQLSGYQWRVLLVIVRETWGYEEFDGGPRRQKHKISITTFQKKTGLHRRHAHQALKELINRNIVTEIRNGKSIKYGIQKDYSKWLSLPKSAQTKNRDKCTEISNASLPKSVTQSLPKSVPYKERKENIKESGGGPTDLLKGQGPSLSDDFDKAYTPEAQKAARECFRKIDEFQLEQNVP